MAARMLDLGSFIRSVRHARELSLRHLSEASGVSNPYLSQIERGLRRPSAEVLKQIGAALGVAVEELYVRAGILDQDDLVARIRQDPDLTGEQKEALVRLYLEFRGGEDSQAG